MQQGYSGCRHTAAEVRSDPTALGAGSDCWKSVIGPKLKSRSFSRQITKIKVGQKVLNTMTALGRPVFERIA